MARGVLKDIGPAAKASGGLKRLAECQETCSERDTHNLLAKRLKLSLPAPISKLGPDGDMVPYLRFRDWCSFLLKFNLWHVLAGLLKPDRPREMAIFRRFWELYEQIEPSHPLYAMCRTKGIDCGTVAPVLFHGDEGRGRRKQGFLVTSFFGLLGRGTRAGLEHRRAHGQSFLKLLPNYVGHTYTTRFLHGMLPKALYNQPGVFNALMEAAAEEARHMFENGVRDPHSGCVFRTCLLHVTGDWVWLHKVGNLGRSFNNSLKHAVQRKKPVGICHLCRAGQEDSPFEQIHSRDPAWLSTRGEESPFVALPALAKVPGVPCKMPAIFAWDFWHSWHLGCGKTFVGSVWVLLAEQVPGTWDARFASLSASFISWCKMNKRSPCLSRITRDTMAFSSVDAFPCAAWHKGATTTIVMDFLEWFLRAMPARTLWLEKSLEACVAINGCLRALYTAEAFIQADAATRIGEQGLQFLRRYAWLAKASHEAGRPLFGMIPKLHCLHHIFLEDLVLRARVSSHALNPICFGAQQSEDYIGRGSRLSRRVHPKTVVQRSVERHLKAAYACYIEAGLLQPPA